MNLQESIRRILREETELPLYIRRRVSMEELDDLVLDVKDLIDSNYDKTDAIYDTVRQFVATKKEFKFNDETEQVYWDSYIEVEKPLVKYVKTNLHESIRRILREELNNRGDCNIMYVPEHFSKLDRFSNLWDMVVNEIDELIEVSQLEKELLPKDITVYSVQEKFDIEYVKRMDDERYNKSDISLFKYKNKLYIIDGHHRLCYDRINNRDSYVYIFDKDDSQIVDCIFYGIGDC